MCKNSFCKSFCFIVIIITLFASCYSREEREIRRLIGRKVDLTGPYLYMDSINVFDTIPYGSGVRIMTILDYNECYTCTFKALINLQNLIQKGSAEILVFGRKIRQTRETRELVLPINNGCSSERYFCSVLMNN